MNKILKKNECLISEVLKDFFSILPSRISDDFGSLRLKRNSLRELERTFRQQALIGSREIVESYHRRLLLSAEMSRVSKLPKDLLLFSATLTAHEISELSCAASTGKGGLRKCLEFEESPEEQILSEEVKREIASSDQMFDQIHDAVFLDVLERYGMDDYARLFEKNRRSYEIRFEVGRRLVASGLVEEEEHLETLARFRERFGAEAEQEFLRRLRQHSLLPN